MPLAVLPVVLCNWATARGPFIDEAQGHWQAEFAHLTSDEQCALTPFILDMAIIQTSRRHDYAAMLDVLSQAQAIGLSDAPLCRQAAELLDRLAKCGTAMAARDRCIPVSLGGDAASGGPKIPAG